MENAAQENDLDASIAAEMAQPETQTEPEATTEAVESNEIEADPAPAQENIDEKSEPDAVTKRINKITADKYGEQRRADGLQAELDALKAAQNPVKPLGEAPTLEDSGFDEEKHNAALIDYGIEKGKQANAKQQADNQAQVEQQSIQKKFADREAEYSAGIPGYAESLANLPKFHNDTLQTILQLDNGPQMAHYLGKNLEVAHQIATLPPMQAAMKLGEIRMNLTNTKPTTKPSAAPAPVVTLTSGSSQSKDIGEMSMDEIYGL